MSKDVSKYAFLVLLAILVYFSIVVVWPFLSYIFFSIVLVMVFMPVYHWLEKKTGKPKISSLVLVFALIVLLVLPSIFIGVRLIKTAPTAYDSLVKSVNVAPLEQRLLETSGQKIDVSAWLTESNQRFRQYIVGNAGSVLSSATGIILGLFLMFFVMYYLFTQGEIVLNNAKQLVPLEDKHKNRLFKEIGQVIHGTIEGQVYTGLIQGILGGILFAVVGLANPLFWGFIMVIFSVIPFLGAGIIWLPAALYLLLQGSLLKGIIVLIGGIIISYVDNFLRPYIVGRYAEVHPALVLVGVLGGLKAFGFVGFVLGPLVLALLVAFLRVYKEEMQ